MGLYFYIIIGFLIIISIYLFTIYKLSLKLNNQATESLIVIDMYVKEKWDLIPNMIKFLKEYVEDEISTLEHVILLRNKIYDNMSFTTKIKIDLEFKIYLYKLINDVKKHQNLTADGKLAELSSCLIKLENDIYNYKKEYNSIVKNIDYKIKLIGGNNIANLIGLKKLKMLDLE